MTIGSQHTIIELKDLIKAKDLGMAVVDKNFLTVSPTWKASPEGKQWLSDWNGLKGQYFAATSLAKPIIFAAELTPISDTMIPAEDAYQRVLKSVEGLGGITDFFSKSQEGIVLPNGYQDLFNRLNAVSPTLAAADRAIGRKIQPTPGSDFDLNVFNATKPAEKATNWLMIGGIALCGIAAVVATKEVLAPIGQILKPIAASRSAYRARREFPPDSDL